MRYEQHFLDEAQSCLRFEELSADQFTYSKQMFGGVEIRTGTLNSQNQILITSLATGDSILITPE